MKTQRTYLLVLALEIVAITILHSVKPGGVTTKKDVSKTKPASTVALQPHFSLIEFK